MKCKCLRCDYEWNSRADTPPKVCPKCSSYYWQTPSKWAKKGETK